MPIEPKRAQAVYLPAVDSDGLARACKDISTVLIAMSRTYDVG